MLSVELDIYCEHLYLSCSALGAVNGRAFLGFAEKRVLRVAAPQLLAWVVGAVLKETVMLAFTHAACKARIQPGQNNTQPDLTLKRNHVQVHSGGDA